MNYELTFDYVPSDGFLYKFDARCKWPAFLLISALVLKLHLAGMLILSFSIVGLSFAHPANLRKNLKISRSWVIFLLVVFLFKTFNLPLRLYSFVEAIIIIWKIIFWITLAMLMSASTKPGDTVKSINYFLRFLPLKWNHRISMMVTLTLRFIPIFLKEFDKIHTACRARLGNRKNLKDYLRYILLPFLKMTFKRTNSIATAIWARGYREDHPLRFERIPATSILALIVTVAFVIFLVTVDNWYMAVCCGF